MHESLLRKKAVPESHKLRFLLDENVSSNLKKELISNKYEVKTVQDLNKRGAKNSVLMELARKQKCILITYYKEFMDYNYNIDNYIVIIDIHPLIDENVLPEFRTLLKVIDINVFKEDIIILKQGEIEYKKKKLILR